MRILLIENPVAGEKKRDGYLEELMDTFAESNAEVDVCVTEKKGDANRYAREAAEKAYDIVVCVGGDGTLNEVVSGLMDYPDGPRIGYIPAGISNDMAYSLRLPRQMGAAGRVALEGHEKRLDVGRMNGEHFVYLVSFGTLAEVAFDTPRDLKRRFGKMAYFVRGFLKLKDVRAQHAVVEHDGGLEEGDYVFCSVSNARRVGGGLIRFSAEQAVMDDGLFELLLVKKPRHFAEMIWVLLCIVFTGSNRHYVTLHHTSRARIIGDEPIHWCVDGEDGGVHLDAKVELCRQSARMMIG